MPFSLSLYLYRSLQRKVQKEFEKENRILSSEDIEYLLTGSDKGKIIKIFKSAVVDHEPVDGIPYYLMPPLAPLLYHDNFKRCLIADALSGYAGSLDDEQSKDAVEVLDVLCGDSCAGYVQVFAWGALGRWAKINPSFIDPRKGALLKAFGGDTASLLAACLFLDSVQMVCSPKEIFGLIDEGRQQVRYKVQKALLGYFLTKLAYPAQYGLAEKDVPDFLNKCRSYELISPNNFEEGCREIGLIPRSQTSGLKPGTQQADICCRLRKMGGDYVSAAGFYLRTYWGK